MRIRFRFLIYSLLSILPPVYAQASENFILFDIGNSVSTVFDMLGPDGINYFAVFGLVTSAVYFAAHTSAVRSNNETPPGIGLIAAILGFIGAYYVYINELDFVGIIAPYTMVLVAGFIALLMYNFIKNFERGESEGNNLLFGGVGFIVFGLITSSLLDSKLAAIASTMYSIGIICIALFVILKGKNAISSASRGGGDSGGWGSSGGDSSGDSSGGSSGGGSSMFSRTPRSESALGERAISDLDQLLSEFDTVDTLQVHKDTDYTDQLNRFLAEIDIIKRDYRGALAPEKIRLAKELASSHKVLIDNLSLGHKDMKNVIKRLKNLRKTIERDINSLKGTENETERISRNEKRNEINVRLDAHVKFSDLVEQDLAFLDRLGIKGIGQRESAADNLERIVPDLEAFKSFVLTTHNRTEKDLRRKIRNSFGGITP